MRLSRISRSTLPSTPSSYHLAHTRQHVGSHPISAAASFCRCFVLRIRFFPHHRCCYCCWRHGQRRSTADTGHLVAAPAYRLGRHGARTARIALRRHEWSSHRPKYVSPFHDSSFPFCLTFTDARACLPDTVNEMSSRIDALENSIQGR